MAIKKCKCSHEYQDSKYGKGNRVHNMGGGSGKSETKTWKCTVCGTKKTG